MSDMNISSVARTNLTGQVQQPRLWKSAQDFQEVFLGQFVQAMRSTETSAELFEEAPGRETFDQMFSEALGRQLALSDSLGLQRLLYRQMGGTFGPSETPRAAQAPSAGAIHERVE